MPVYQAPQSDAQRLDALRAITATGPQDIAAGKTYVDQDTLDAVATRLAQFETAYFALSSKLSGRAREVSEKDLALTKLQTYVRDFWDVMRRRNTRMEYPVSVLNFFGLPQDGLSPKPTQEKEWITWAELAVKGDTEAVTAGYPAMSNPTAAEVQTILTAYQTQAADIAPADRAYDDAQAAVAALRPQTDELIQDVMDQLRFALRKLDGPSQRRIMRSYGAYFRPLPGEVVEEETGGEGV